MYPPENEYTDSNQRVGQQSANGHHVNKSFEVEQERHDSYGEKSQNQHSDF